MNEQKEKLNRDAEYQRRCAMSEDERRLITKDIMAKNLYDQRMKENVKTTWEDCQRHAAQIMHKELRKEREKPNK